MSGLVEIVAKAEAQFAASFVVQGGGPMEVTTHDGDVHSMGLIDDSFLMGAVEAHLDSDQQMDLMVGRPVAVSIGVSGTQWRLLVEPGESGMCLRGSRVQSEAPDGLNIQLGAARPAEPRSEAPIFSAPITRGSKVTARDNPTVDDHGIPVLVDDLGTPPPVQDDAFASGAFPPRSPHVQAQGAAVDDGFGMVAAPAMAEEEREITLFEKVGDEEAESGAEHDVTLLQGAPEEPETNDATLMQHHNPAVQARIQAEAQAAKAQQEQAASPTSAAALASGPSEELPTVRKLPVARTPHGTLMGMGLADMDLGDAPPSAPAASEPVVAESPSTPEPSSPGQFEASEELEMGTLCFVRNLEDAMAAGGRLGMGVEVIQDDDVRGGFAPSATTMNLEPGASLIVTVDDPSAILSWILIRREEGFRVFVVTRAMRPEGARRVLLGLQASPTAEAWLDAFPVVAMVGENYMPV